MRLAFPASPKPQGRSGPGGSPRRHRAGPSTQEGRRSRSPERSLRCHDARCEEADQEIREVLRRF